MAHRIMKVLQRSVIMYKSAPSTGSGLQQYSYSHRCIRNCATQEYLE